MQAHDLDNTYRTLAQAVHSAGQHSELFLAMLSLKLIAQSEDTAQIQQAIESVLQDLQTHEKATP
jgi:hypothetical protein